MWFRKKRLYVDAAAATPISPEAKHELVRLLDLYGNPGALHKEAVDAKNELEAARSSIAASTGAHADEIIFVASGTEANNLSITGVLGPLLRAGKKASPVDGLRPRVHAITSVIEHHSVLEPLRALQSEGLLLTELPVDSEGLVSAEQVTNAITDSTVFVSIQLINSEIGTIEPIRDIAKVLRRASHKIYFHCDASQAPLWLRVNVEKLGVDLLTLDAQKILGPKGVGALYVRRGVVLEPMMRGSKQERGLRGGTENTPLVGSFAVALAAAQKGVEERAERIAAVRDACVAEIQKYIPDVYINGPSSANRVANNINLSVPGLDREMAVIGLDAEGVAATTRSACNVVDKDPSHVIEAIGTPKELHTTAIRITFLPDATLRDARRVARALTEIARRYRSVV
ncbi:MAG: cysteine desulfurase family protein [Candidatus Adlerbacteria bacterium]|nr:cysteine desulfurase family protein [Candidatus Adlerbacteria bacterium]